MKIQFYCLHLSGIEKMAGKLLKKALADGYRAVVLVDSDERLDYVDGLLWNDDPDSFIAHGSAKDGNAEHQPIWLSTQAENPNNATLLCITDGRQMAELEPPFERVIDIFDGSSSSQLQAAKQRWQAYASDESHTVEAVIQEQSGRWKVAEMLP